MCFEDLGWYGAVSRCFGAVVLSLKTNKYDFPTTKCRDQRAAKVLQRVSTVFLWRTRNLWWNGVQKWIGKEWEVVDYRDGVSGYVRKKGMCVRGTYICAFKGLSSSSRLETCFNFIVRWVHAGEWKPSIHWIFLWYMTGFIPTGSKAWDERARSVQILSVGSENRQNWKYYIVTKKPTWIASQIRGMIAGMTKLSWRETRPWNFIGARRLSSCQWVHAWFRCVSNLGCWALTDFVKFCA